MAKIKIPSFIDYTYTKWHFWLIVILSTFFAGFSSIAEFLGIIVGTALTLSIFYFFSYLLTRSTLKKINKI